MTRSVLLMKRFDGDPWEFYGWDDTQQTTSDRFDRLKKVYPEAKAVIIDPEGFIEMANNKQCAGCGRDLLTT